MGPWHGELRGSGGWCSEPGLGFRAGRGCTLCTHTRSLIFPTFFWFFQLVLLPGAALGDPEQSSTAAAGVALGWCSPAPPLPAQRGAIAHRLEPEI